MLEEEETGGVKKGRQEGPIGKNLGGG